ncbi:hypothetical protein [Achromobacter aegrifaciens]
MHGLLPYILGLVACALAAALLRQPGVMLYDWIATRAGKRQAAIREAQARVAVKSKQRRPATQAG